MSRGRPGSLSDRTRPRRRPVVARVAKQLGTGTELVRQWVAQAAVDAGRRQGTASADVERIASIRTFIVSCDDP